MNEGLRATGWSLAYLAGGIAVAFGIIGFLETLPGFLALGALPVDTLESVVLLGVMALASWLIGGKALHLTARDLGIVPVGPGMRRLGWGFGIGAVLAGAAMAIAVPLGHAAWRGDGGSVAAWARGVGVIALVMVPAAIAEEMTFRGVPMLGLATAWGRVPALVGLAVCFALAHLGNEGVTPLGLFNIAMAGIVLGLAFFLPGRLWTSTGLHLGWNLTLAALAAPVSGIAIGMPGVDYDPGGPGWLTGAAFGPEGGLVASGCLLAGTFFLMRRVRVERRS